ncbi:hypothetical protein ACFSM5_15175 [Lacibacterium aquatile]|uniref:Helix-turn-helix domain-containing protein n=1 Tax=Lacibacterium aquatile TaxID=1168082 RepID=A0ABW5DU79_9PROT
MSFERIDQTVVAHDAASATPRPADLPRPARSRWLGAAEKEAEAHKLRARGHSYRRIAEVLQVQYGLVSRWLSGLGESLADSAPAEPRRFTRTSVLVRATPDVDAPPVEIPTDFLTRYQAMEQRVGDLLATLKQVASENRERENRLYKALEDERKAAEGREAALRAEITEIRELLEQAASVELAPDFGDSREGDGRPSTLPSNSLLGRLSLWRRGGVG